MADHFQRGVLLLNQARPGEAELEFRRALADEPFEAVTHSYLALCLAQQKKFRDATEEAQHAVHLEPDSPFTHYVLASVLYDRNRFKEAEAAIDEALRLDPYDESNFSLKSVICLQQKKWKQALEAAEAGLEIDPEDSECINCRAIALRQLGRMDQAGDAISAALQREPEDATSHTNMGWVLLEKGQHKKAMEHFREALRLDPNMDWARMGIVEALKSKNIIYRLMLGYFLWMSKLSETAQWGVVIGAFIGYRVLRGFAENNPGWSPVLQPLLWLYIAFAVMTWIADPLFNLMLRLNKFGRLALSRDQIVASNWVGVFMLAAVIFFVQSFIFPQSGTILAALVCGLMVLPVSAVYRCDEGWPRNWMVAYTFLMAALGATAIGALFLVPLIGGPLQMLLALSFLPSFYLYLGAAFLCAFVANWLMSRTVRY